MATALAELTFDPGADNPAPRPVRITRASLLADGGVYITTEPAPEDTWRLADPRAPHVLIRGGHGATAAGPLAGPLVHVVDSSEAVLSNHVVVDDLDALHRVLQVGERTGSGRPPELTTADLDTPLGEALLFLHRHVVMDVSERAGAGGGGDATRDEAAGNDGDDDLWNRLSLTLKHEWVYATVTPATRPASTTWTAGSTTTTDTAPTWLTTEAHPRQPSTTSRRSTANRRAAGARDRPHHPCWKSTDQRWGDRPWTE